MCPSYANDEFFVYLFLLLFPPFSLKYVITKDILLRRSIKNFHNLDTLWLLVEIFTNASFVEDCFDLDEVMAFCVRSILKRLGRPFMRKPPRMKCYFDRCVHFPATVSPIYSKTALHSQFRAPAFPRYFDRR